MTVFPVARRPRRSWRYAPLVLALRADLSASNNSITGTGEGLGIVLQESTLEVSRNFFRRFLVGVYSKGSTGRVSANNLMQNVHGAA